MFMRFMCLSISILLALIPMQAFSQSVTIPHDGPDQMPIIYVHGFNADGATWHPHGGPYWESLGFDTNPDPGVLDEQDSYVIQWLSPDNEENATAAEGWAVLRTLDDLENGNALLSPDPIGFFLSNAYKLSIPVSCPNANLLDPTTWFDCDSPALDFIEELSQKGLVSNYNRNGATVHHSLDMLDLLRSEFSPGGRFAALRQINIVTHSAGGVDTRAQLHRLNFSPSKAERERIGNVYYTAPPFGGSTLAELGGILYSGPVQGSFFVNPWFTTGLGDQSQPVRVLLKAMIATYVRDEAFPILNQQIDDMADQLINVGLALGFNLAATAVDLANSSSLRDEVAAGVEAIKGLVSFTMGYPAQPKLSTDLDPQGSVDNLNAWSENPHTKQFVIWGEGDPVEMNVSPTLNQAASNYNNITDTNLIQKTPGDLALSSVSATMLSTLAPGGYMQAVQGYPGLNHMNIHTEMSAIGFTMLQSLVCPTTQLVLDGPLAYLNVPSRYGLVGPSTLFSFDPVSVAYEDQFGDNGLATAAEIRYRVVVFPDQGSAQVGNWQIVLPSFQDTFSSLDSVAPLSLNGEQLFRLDWQSVNLQGGREHIRTCFFRMDMLAPSVTLTDVFNVIAGPSKVCQRGGQSRGRLAVRSSLLEAQVQNPNLNAILNLRESDWVVQNTTGTFIRVDFNETGFVDYAWDDPGFSSPTTVDLISTIFSLHLADFFDDGLHTLYFRGRDGSGNQSVLQQISILVDKEPPLNALNYEPVHPLDFVVGPNTQLHYTAQDVEFGGAEGVITVPGHPEGTLSAPSLFTMGQTNIAATAPVNVEATWVDLVATSQDKLGNTANHIFRVLYDWTAPPVSVQFVGDVAGTTAALKLASGNYRTAEDVVRIEIRAGDGLAPDWQLTQPGNTNLLSGGPLSFGQAGGRPTAWYGDIELLDGLNLLTFVSRDVVGNPGAVTFAIEKTDQVIDLTGDRDLEVLSRRDDSVDDAISNAGSVQSVQVSDDGSVFVFESGRKDLIPGDLNDQSDVFAWQNGSIVMASSSELGDLGNGRSYYPAISGNGAFVYFASWATNLVPGESLTGVNLYVKELATGRITLINRDRDGFPADLSVGFAGTTAYLNMAATYDGRYLFFNDRFDNYIVGDTNSNHDIYCIDLDPDLDGDLMQGNTLIRRVSLGPAGEEGFGGLISTGGSLRPTCTADGLEIAFDTSHTNLFSGDTNGDVRDAVVARFNGVDAMGTIDFSSVTTVPLNVYAFGHANEGDLCPKGGRQAWVDRTGKRISFITEDNLDVGDTNSQTSDSDVYISFELAGGVADRYVVFAGDGNGVLGPSAGRIANNHKPSITIMPGGGGIYAYVADKTGLTTPGRATGLNDLFIYTLDNGFERINWTLPNVPTDQALIDGGVTRDGRWAWWATTQEYHGTIGSGGGIDLYRRRIETDVAGGVVTDTVPKNLPQTVTSESGSTLDFDVVLASQPNREVRVGVVSSDPGEGMPSPEVLVFTPDDWDMPQSFSVMGMDDGIYDGDQEYVIRVTGYSDDSLYDNVLLDELIMTNTDNDAAPTVGFKYGWAVVNEGDGVVPIQLSLSGNDSELPVLIDYAALDVSANSGSDFDVPAGMVTFIPGVRETPFAIQLVDDGAPESVETFDLLLSSPTNASLGSGMISVTIDDNDPTAFLNFVDPEFEQFLLEGMWQDPNAQDHWIDINGDGGVTASEAGIIHGAMDGSGQGIQNLGGLEQFTAVVDLVFANNRLVDLPDLSSMTDLEMLDLNENRLMTAPTGLATVPNLLELDLRYNLLNVSACGGIATLEAAGITVFYDSQGNPGLLLTEMALWPNGPTGLLDWIDAISNASYTYTLTCP